MHPNPREAATTTPAPATSADQQRQKVMQDDNSSDDSAGEKSSSELALPTCYLFVSPIRRRGSFATTIVGPVAGAGNMNAFIAAYIV